MMRAAANRRWRLRLAWVSADEPFMGALHTFEYVHSMPDFWVLSDQQLARTCMCIAEGRLPDSRPLLRAEAMRLFLLWHESMNAVLRTPEISEQQACLLAALRKRTIQILVSQSLISQNLVSTAPGSGLRSRDMPLRRISIESLRRCLPACAQAVCLDCEFVMLYPEFDSSI
jgi:hypothetical protein